MTNYARESRPWLIWLTIIAVILAGVGIFFYYNFFRQSKSELIEAIPTDAAFIFAVNDNDGFVTSSAKIAPYLNELFVMDALPAYETMRGKLPDGEYDLTISGHATDNSVSVLFNMHADKAAFKRLLRALSIDPNNYTGFEGNRIYTYGTNFKSMKFVYVNHIISFSTDIELLKRAIVQHAHPKNLLSDKQFKEIYNLTEKNRKQNWLIVNPKGYLSYLNSFLQESCSHKIVDILENSGWTAFQLRFSVNEMFMSGYMLTDAPENDRFDILVNRSGDGMSITDLYPSQCHWYAHLETPRAKELGRLNSRCRQKSIPIMDLNPTEAGYFSIRRDSVNYAYAILLSDTNMNVLEAFYGDKADSAQAATTDGIYLIPTHKENLTKTFALDSVNCFVQKGGALIFATSKEAMKVYQNSLKTSGSLSQNRYYPFVNEAVASSSLLNWVMINDGSSPYWSSQLSDKGKSANFSKDLRIFSLSCETMEKDSRLVPINLYLLF